MFAAPIALNATTLAGNDPLLSLDIARSAGLKSLELTGGRSEKSMIRPGMTASELAAWRERLSQAGLSPLAIGAHRNLADPKEFEDFLLLLRHGAALGCQVVTTGVPDGCQEAAYAAGLRKASKQAASLGLRLCVENHGREHGSGASLLPLLSLCPDAFLCYDTGNAVFYGRVDPEADLGLCAARVGHMHLKDKGGAADEWNFPALGEGVLDLPALLALAENARVPSASVEVEFTPAGASPAEARRAVCASADYLRSLPHGRGINL